MKITYQAFTEAFGVHVGETLLPAVANPFAKFLLGGAACTPALFGEQTKKAMTFLGIADAEGNVDIDALETFLTNCFKAQPTLPIPLPFVNGIALEKSDADAFIKRLKGVV